MKHSIDRILTTHTGSLPRPADLVHMYARRANGEVVLTKATRAEGGDPVVGAFLSFLARDMANHPEQIRSLNADLVTRIRNLTADVEVNLDQPLSADDE